MRELVKSLKRLYTSNKLTKEQIKERLDNNTITLEEYNYIINVG